MLYKEAVKKNFAQRAFLEMFVDERFKFIGNAQLWLSVKWIIESGYLINERHYATTFPRQKGSVIGIVLRDIASEKTIPKTEPFREN